MVKVSIAIATYQGEAYLKEQLDSFSAQNVLPDEVVACDDGSTDRTIEILEQYQRVAPFPVKIYRNNINVGLIGNFEKALSLCTGDVIFLSDQDDVWFPTKLSAVLSRFRSQPDIQVVVNDQAITDERLVPLGVTANQNARRLGLTDSVIITGCCTAMRRSWRDFCLPFPKGIPAHDNWIGNLAIYLGVRTFADEPLQYYRRHQSNASSWIVNSGDKLQLSRLVRSVRTQDARARWEKDIVMLHAIRERIAGASRLFGLSEFAEDAARDRVDRKIRSIRDRIAIIGTNKYARPAKILRLILQGGYSNIASAVADMFR